MIGPSHLPEPSRSRPPRTRPLRTAVVTGSRAEFGLLAPVMRAVAANTELELMVIAAGSHLIQPADTFRDVKALFPVTDSIPMQVAGRTGRYEDAEAVGKGVGRFSRSFQRLNPDWVVLLGDRIEPFAAAAAAAIMGIAIAHIHGGDRAEGIADESMRHAISKLAHVHFPATKQSADRLIRMGEKPEHVFIAGSPAIDGLATVAPMPDAEFEELGNPTVVVMHHPIGRHAEMEEAAMSNVLAAVKGERVLIMHPNHDAGRDGILRAIEHAALPTRSHLPREKFIALLKRLAQGDGVLIGNSSAGLIEAAALKLPFVDIGPRQNGREKPGNVVHVQEGEASVREGLAKARAMSRQTLVHPYGDGKTGVRIAEHLAAFDPRDAALLRKLCAY
jgi:UDP-hydrolysing UDP-N-acetyl-D-glucosamine 2-epimerase